MQQDATSEFSADVATRQLEPIWRAMQKGDLDRHDNDSVARRVAALPALPALAALQTLATDLQQQLDRWEQEPPDLTALETITAQALVAWQTVRAHADPPGLPEVLDVALHALEDLYSIQASTEDLALRIRLLEDIGSFQDADIGVLPPALQLPYLLRLGRALHDCYRLRGDGADLAASHRLLDTALSLTADPINRTWIRITQARVLRDRYLEQDNAADLATSISLLEDAIVDEPPHRLGAECLSNLGLNLYLRYMRDGAPDDLARCIQLHQEALHRAPGGFRRPGYLNNLGIALDYRYRQYGDPADLDARVQLQEEAYMLAPVGLDRRIYVSNLGNVLRDRFYLRGDPADLERRVSLQQEACALTSGGPQQALCLNNLGNAYADRSGLRGDRRDLDVAIDLLNQAVSLTPAGPYRSMLLENYGLYLLRRCSTQAPAATAQEDLNKSICVLEEALALTAGGPERPGRLNTLGTALYTRFRQGHDPSDLQRAIALMEEAIILTPSGPNRAEYLANLSEVLSERVTIHGTSIDLGRAVALLEEAVSLAGTWEMPTMARSLGLLVRRQAHDDDHPVDEQQTRLRAATAFEKGAAGLERILAAAEEPVAIGLLGRFGDLYDLLVETYLDLIDVAVQIDDRDAVAQYHLAAYLAAERGKGRRAAALLATRAVRPTPQTAVLLPRLDSMRTELARLDRQIAGMIPLAPATLPGARLRGSWLAETAEPAGAGAKCAAAATPGPTPGSGPGEHLRAVLVHRADMLWRDLQDLLETITRSDPAYAGICGFAAPRAPEEVALALPPGGSLLLLYPLDSKLACFVLRHSTVSADVDLRATSVALDRPTLGTLVAQVFPTGRSGIPPQTAVLDAVLTRLSRLLYPALAPLLPPPDPECPPTLVLAPTGALHRLPLHACPWPGASEDRLLDGYAVSYVTTADVLPLMDRKSAAAGGAVALAPGLPLTPAGAPLSASLAEAALVAEVTGGRALLRTQATVAALLRQRVAAGKRWVLLATHGRAGGTDAARSGLLFYDEHGREPVWLSAAEILSLLDVDGAEHLALGACSTHADDAAPGDRLAGLLRALLYRGARSVQAALWPVRDDAAALLSMWCWQTLLGGETDKASALREAMRRLRRCIGAQAALEIRRLASCLPDGDPARQHLDEMADDLETQAQPFRRTVDWAPFVLHGVPGVSRVAARLG